MVYKYLPKPKSKVCRPKGGNYRVGKDSYTRDRYYAWLKHKSFRQSRNQEYNLTWEDWDAVWTHELWSQRGRGLDNVQMYRIDPLVPWQNDNIEILSRKVRGCKVKYDQ